MDLHWEESPKDPHRCVDSVQIIVGPSQGRVDGVANGNCILTRQESWSANSAIYVIRPYLDEMHRFVKLGVMKSD